MQDEWECSSYFCNWRYKSYYAEEIKYRCDKCNNRLIKQPSQKVILGALTELEECEKKAGWNLRSAWDYYLSSLEQHIGVKKGRDLDRYIDDALDLSSRTNTCLKKVGIKFLHQLVRLSKEDLKEIKNIGSKSIKEIEELLSNINLRLGMSKNINKETIELYEVTADKAEEVGDYHLARELRRSARNYLL